jgi:formylglycine-generating enzyme required for sulfatase activity
MVVDLSGGQNTNAYPVFYYPSMDALPYGGVTNSLYKADYLVMRKIPSGGFNMGEYPATTAVTLSQDFYAGVFEVTQEQWYNVMGGARAANFTDAASRAFRPMEMVSYGDIRGTNDSAYAESFVGRLRTKTGLSGFDLPTEAQWEFACRAGTDTCFNDGDADANVSGANANTNAWLDALGRYKFNGGFIDGVTPPAAGCGPANGTAIVGSYAPNAWGLYDTHGNVWEWCLDWYQAALEGGTDPDGADSGPARVIRGGSWYNPATNVRSAYRHDYDPSSPSHHIGFRLVRTLP